MKYLATFFLIVVCGYSFTQNNYETREEKLQQLKARTDIKVTEVKKDIIKLEYPDGRVLYKNIADYQQQEATIQRPKQYPPTYDSTIIDLRTIDTTLYYQKFKFWQEIPIGSGPNNFLLTGDVNNNKFSELYGRKKKYTTNYTNIIIFEMNELNTFDSVYSYDSTSIALSIYDVDKDGMEEVHLRRFADMPYPGNSYLFYRKAALDSLAKILAFVFYPFVDYTQQNDNKFGNWDGDNLTDQIFHILGLGLYIFEYNPLCMNFDSVYLFDYTYINQEFAGFTIGDFDQDNKTEFFTGSTHGDVLCIENRGNNDYLPTWTGSVETHNAYQLTQTNDIDRNGKKEIWVGGDAFYPGIGPMTRITLFEADGNNSYKVVGRIDLIGVFSTFAQNYQAIDVDKDGTEEMMICIEQTVLILKFNGRANHQEYNLFYFRQNDLSLSGRNSVYYGTVMHDINNDGREEIIISMDEVIQNVGLRLFSQIYKPNFIVGLLENENMRPVSYQLFPVYPNPFNSTTNIKFNIAKSSFVSLKVYNSLGKEITALLEKETSPGSYNISWEAKDSNGNLLPSGVYLIRLTADNYAKSIKTLLLK